MTERYLGLDYLRALLVVQVVAFHSAFAYAGFGRSGVLPIADSAQWPGFAVFVKSSDVFFMSLMFLISGLFVWPSLARKGAGAFAWARVLRLGLPFALGVVVLMPLAYYAAYRAAGMRLELSAYWAGILAHWVWPAGPLWFIWQLLALDLAAAALYRAAPGASRAFDRLMASAGERPLRFFLAFLACAAVAYLPLVAIFGPYQWLSVGPFAVHPSRILHYALYFLVGVAVGAHGIERGLLGGASRLVRHWPGWVVAAVALNLAFAAPLFPLAGALTALPPLLATLVYGLTFVSACAATAFALLAVCQRFLTRRSGLADSLAASSYGIYLVHYVFVLWAQYLLLGASLPAGIKAMIVLASALALSWLGAALVQRPLARLGRPSKSAEGEPDAPARRAPARN